MAMKLVVDAFEGRLSAEWTRCEVFGLNRQGEPPGDGSSFVSVSYPVANSEQLTVGDPGNNVFREEGAVVFTIMAQRGGGVSTGLTWADDLAKLFRSKKFGGITTFAPSSPAIDDRNEDGGYFKLSLSVPYQADILG